MKVPFILLLCCSLTTAQAAYIFKDGKFINSREIATHSVQEHFGFAKEAYEQKKWEECLKQTVIIAKNFPGSPFSHETQFYAAVSHFHLGEYDFSNEQFSEYLKHEAPSKHFEEAIHYKFQIAEKFQAGVKKHLFGTNMLPKWMPAEQDAIVIYDEVIAALPHHDLGAHALYGKATLLIANEDYQEGVETLQLLIRRFPKHPLTPESYLKITQVYLTQTKADYPDPDLLDLAEINIKKFRSDFPSEPKIEEAVMLLTQMKEVYAKSLYETGRFFERTKKPQAALIYYSKIVTKYPETPSAKLSEKRLNLLNDGKIVQRTPKELPPEEVIVQTEPALPAQEETKEIVQTEPAVPTQEETKEIVQLESAPVTQEQIELTLSPQEES